MRKTSPTNHSLAPPTLPLEIPETQSPVRSFGSTGANRRSLGSIANEVPFMVNAIEVEVVQGIVNPPWPSA